MLSLNLKNVDKKKRSTADHFIANANEQRNNEDLHESVGTNLRCLFSLKNT